MHETTLANLITQNEWADIPLKITTREDHPVDTSANEWHLPYPMRSYATLDFRRIIHPTLQWITKRYIQVL